MRQRIVNGIITTKTENDHNFYATESNVAFSASTTVQEIGNESGVSYGDNEDCKITRVNQVTIGKAKRDPGYNFDGTKAEDMYYADKPPRSVSIKQDPVFLKSDSDLGLYLNTLMSSLSIGKMETLALDMANHFTQGIGGTYKNEILDNEIANNNAFVSYHSDFLKALKTELKNAAYNPANMSSIAMNLLNFSSFWDKVSGLGITVHQVWSVKAELKNYSHNSCTGLWQGTLLYTFYDHFGLDWDDIVKHGSDRIPQYHTGDFFKAWYILQHYRSAKPFITEFYRSVYLSGNSKRS
ncbi:DUF3289 family protein [Psychroserpens sp. NJDZ02]|uniref:DUF3289 family protein n=1 Tax=Psychroserpens sp. NJDZ02 TaxID=2570561 RepID=UPI0010A930B0|nr:DUF3289 family protein [Psychroserpens sp. NJDZ02]QCE42450.1 DUF3289 family protein [Psychroserpens sp. NJDZ02]